MPFNLSTEPWIPVVIDGRRVDVSLSDALCNAHEIDGLATDDPLTAAAVFRQVLLPTALHATDVPRTAQQWAERWDRGCFDVDRISAYLAEHADRFDLFDPERPFAQVAGLTALNGEVKPISLVLPAVASGNNVPLFSARTDVDPPTLSPAEAARAVLVTHCWDTAAIKSGAVGDLAAKAGKTTGNPTGPLGQLGVVLPIGETLFATLLLNIPVKRHGLRATDLPQWAATEPASPGWKKDKEPKGLLDLLTWQSRRIRLVPTEPGGDLIRSVVLCAGDRLARIPEDEPHTAWRMTEKPKKDDPPRRPIRHQPGRSAWRGLTALVATRQRSGQTTTAPEAMIRIARLCFDDRVLPEQYPLRTLTVGVVYGNQQAVIEDVVSDVIPLPVQALIDQEGNEVRETLLGIVDQAEALRLAANRLGDDLRLAAGADKIPWDKGQRLGELLIYSLDGPARRLFQGLARHPDDAERAELVWRSVARRLAEDTAAPVLDAAAASPSAVIGRNSSRSSGGRDWYDRTSTAEAVFRSSLNKILGTRADVEDLLHGRTPIDRKATA